MEAVYCAVPAKGWISNPALSGGIARCAGSQCISRLKIQPSSRPAAGRGRAYPISIDVGWTFSPRGRSVHHWWLVVLRPGRKVMRVLENV
jgi:hypothetical protein